MYMCIMYIRIHIYKYRCSYIYIYTYVLIDTYINAYTHVDTEIDAPIFSATSLPYHRDSPIPDAGGVYSQKSSL